MTKRRIDAWDATLTDDQRWAAYDAFRRFGWQGCQTFVEEKCEQDPPSRTAIYGWLPSMRKAESQHRILTAVKAKEDIKKEIKAVGDIDTELEHLWLSLSLQSALAGDVDAGKNYLMAGMALRDSALEGAKFSLKQEAEKRAGEELDLAKTKFSRETCELFVKWYDDQRAKDINNNAGIGTQEKVEQLGELIFGEDW